MTDDSSSIRLLEMSSSPKPDETYSNRPDPASQARRRQTTRSSTRFSIVDGRPTPSRKVSGKRRTLKQTLSVLLSPLRPVGPTPTLKESVMATLKETWLNVLLICIPVAWGLHFGKQSDLLIFIFSFLAIIPLAKLLGFATEELSLRVGETIGGLLNATLGNAVELIVAIIALIQCKLSLVQSSLIGSILSNICTPHTTSDYRVDNPIIYFAVLVLGMCFFAGGIRFSEQGFLLSAANVDTSLLILSVTGMLIPAAFFSVISSQSNQSSGTADNEGTEVLKMSRGVAVVLLFIYGSYLVFQLWSHSHLYEEDSEFKSTAYPVSKKKKAATGRNGVDPEAQIETAEEEDDVEIPKLSVWFSLVLLVIITVFVAVTAEFLVDSIDGVTQGTALSQEWVGLILLPIVGNAAEHVTAVTVAVKDKLTLSLGVAVGSSIQIALFVIPFITILAWILGKPLTLLFDPFQSVVLFLSVITVNYCIADGKSNWLEGMILMCLYIIIGISLWFYPGFDTTAALKLSCPT
ncbi:hypothetical protein M422DRAFT_778583 [Sphaerobolus stellatus SS14]|uniref:Vacuolar calcium ion transporter n=1 Tax=Sphaerobolus stellatus (strain SS14) TaxID=990650 RepID=A0A0C9VTY0_SPHS4|nr:hypothetical protein M422DRAFT_778583 [Sphaerobolus stellatus SS14]